MDTTTEILYTVGAIAVFVALFFSIGRFFAYRADRIKQKELEDQQLHKNAAAERARAHNQTLALADEGLVSAQLQLAKENESSSPKESLYWYERAAELDSEQGIVGFIRVCDNNNSDLVPQDKYRYWKNALDAAQGDEQAEFEQGLALFEGYGIRSNMDRGLALIEHAASNRCVRAQMFLAEWYRSPENPLADDDKAKIWSERAEGQIEDEQK
ncbi:tetratricopeptide repeat protein [Vibrio gallicus]|uniref:tetratricopeptide repeat protein n=1 Tax=Vibrio gallicus TaxID=190897 RepID=UPI0021C2C5AA|nr:sel1 repeat family protein [Vibrio gallicus]